MKSPTMMGLGLIAFVVGAMLAPRVASEHRTGVTRAAAGSYFRAQVDGDHSARPMGKVTYGPIGRVGEPGAAFTITLAAERNGAAIVFTRLDGTVPPPGLYPIGDTDALDRVGGFRALYVAGSATRPQGVFHAEAGTIEITTANGEGVSGHFDLTARGFLTDDPEDETRQVRVSGAFTSRLTP